MKKLLTLTISVIILTLCFSLSACSKNDWKNADINGYYTTAGGHGYSYSSWGLELYEESINDNTKTFVVRYNNDFYKNGDNIQTSTEFYVSYGYYTIDKISHGTTLEGSAYVRYHLLFDYIVRDKNAPDYDEVTITVTKHNIECLFNRHSLIKEKW